jgi:hypothetical protein
MNNSINRRKSAARTERIQRRLDAGFVAAHYPEVASIVINMVYDQRGVTKSLPRVMNFSPSSCALFKVDCLNKDCADGGFDLTRVITGMIRNRRQMSTGDISCEGSGSSPSVGHSAITYKLTIQYS